MKKKLKIIIFKNQSGQVFLESLFILILIISFTLFSLKAMFHIFDKIQLNALVEQYFICELAENQNCYNNLKHEVNRINSNTRAIIKVENQYEQNKERTKQYLTQTLTIEFNKQLEHMNLHDEKKIFNFGKYIIKREFKYAEFYKTF